MKQDCCQDVIVVHKKKRRTPRVTQRDFEILREMQAEIERIGVSDDERRIRLCLFAEAT